MRVALLGGTGSFGTALARRLVDAGDEVVIGSRDAGRAREAAAPLGAEGATNEDAARSAELVVLATKAEGTLDTARGLREAIGTTPVRLTTQPWIRCGSRGCNIAGTERSSGGTYDAAVCTRFGERTTNGHDTDPADDANPERYESTRYYGVRLSNGTFGFVSEVWIRAADRGGLGLPAC